MAANHFSRAVRRLQELKMPMESALVRLSLARAMARQGDVEGAELQLAAAGRVFGQARAGFYIKQCERLLQESKQPP